MSSPELSANGKFSPELSANGRFGPELSTNGRFSPELSANGGPVPRSTNPHLILFFYFFAAYTYFPRCVL
uniref:Uncharacterized protein n=1 Tax=Anguilla anguilla TaxID=7936 RepID=A0A0E9SVJ9_ANGAN